MLADSQLMLYFLLDSAVTILPFLYCLSVGRRAATSVIPSEMGKRISMNNDGGLGLVLVLVTAQKW